MPLCTLRSRQIAFALMLIAQTDAWYADVNSLTNSHFMRRESQALVWRAVYALRSKPRLVWDISTNSHGQAQASRVACPLHNGRRSCCKSTTRRSGVLDRVRDKTAYLANGIAQITDQMFYPAAPVCGAILVEIRHTVGDATIDRCTICVQRRP